MSKVTEIFTNMFSRSGKTSGSVGSAPKGVLTTDAGAVAPRTDEEIAEAALVERSNSTSSIPPTPTTPSLEIVRQENAEISEIPSGSTMMQRKSPVSLAQVNNTQAYNVFQFTNVNNLHIGSVINISTTEAGGETTRRISPRSRRHPDGERVIRKTPSIDAMMKSQEKLEHDHIEIIATHLGEDWRNVARDLGYSQGQIDQLLEDHHITGVKEVIYQMILGWTQEDTSATLGRITEVLWRRKSTQEAAYYLKEQWKRANKEKQRDRRQSEVSTESTE
ncbi:hypothetical protein DMENIID0001_136070 [Sergentomyia squamirostris]